MDAPRPAVPGRDERADRQALADPATWAAATGALIAELGFRLIEAEPTPGDPPDARGAADLLVGLRASPTLRHFDPERIEHWELAGERGRVATLDRASRIGPERPFAWGRIRVVDRLKVENDFLTFGGRLRAADVDASTRLVQFRSPAPILRWAGHSQGLDPLTDEVGAFFGRLRAAIDVQPEVEARIGETEPLALYAAFAQDAWRRFAATLTERRAEPELAAWARREGHRLERVAPGAVEAGRALRTALGLRPVG